MDASIHLSNTNLDRTIDITIYDLYENDNTKKACIVLKVVVEERNPSDLARGYIETGKLTVFNADRLFSALDAAREEFAHRHEPFENGGPVTYTAEEAEADGWAVDRQVYPWFAYKGPRFSPDATIPIVTPRTRT